MRRPSRRNLRPRLERLEARTVLSLNFAPVVALNSAAGQITAKGVAVDSAGDIFVVGSVLGGSTNLNPGGSEPVSTSTSEGYIAKYSPQGQLLGDSEFSSTTTAGAVQGTGLSLALDAQGNPVVAGTYGGRIFTEKFNGQTVKPTFGISFGNSASDVATGVSVDQTTGNIFLTGTFVDANLPSGGTAAVLTRTGVQDAFVMELNSNVSPVWATDIGTAGAAYNGRAVASDGNGGVYVTSQYQNSSNQSQLYAAELNSTGAISWSHSYAISAGSDFGNEIAQDGSGNEYLVGTLVGSANFAPGNVGTITAKGASDLLLLELNAGNSVYATQIGSGGTSNVGTGIAISTGDHTIDVAGYSRPMSGSTSTQSVLTAQFDSQHNLLATQTFPGTGTLAQATSVAVNAAGKVAVAGAFNGNIPLTGSTLTAPSSDATNAFVMATGLVAPVATADSFQAVQGQPLTVAAPGVLANDSAPTGLTLTAAAGSTPGHGSVTLSSNGSFTYTPAPYFTGTDSFSYTLGDGTYLTSTTTVQITVKPPTSSTVPIGFDENYYLTEYPAVAAAVAAGKYTSGYQQYVMVGQYQGNNPSAFFDEKYYLAENPDVAKAVSSGAIASGFQHFLMYGQQEGRNPSPYFDEAFYMAHNADVAAAVKAGTFASGWQHFVEYGQLEGREPNPVYDETYYLAQNPDVAAAVKYGTFSSGFQHFLMYGQTEGRKASPYFNESYYDSHDPDVAGGIGKPDAPGGETLVSGYEHFLLYGLTEGRIPISNWSDPSYLAANPDVAAAVKAGTFASGFEHFVLYGRFEGRSGGLT